MSGSKLRSHDLISELCEDLKPVKRLPSISKLFGYWLLLCLATTSLGLYWYGVRSDILFRLQDPWFVLETLASLSLGIYATGMALILSIPGQIQSREHRFLAFTPMILWLLLITFKMKFGPTTWEPSFQITHCLWDTVLLAAIPAFALMMILRKALPFEKTITGVLAFSGAAGVAGVAVQLSCGASNPYHLFDSHFLPALCIAIAGVLIGNFFLKSP